MINSKKRIFFKELIKTLNSLNEQFLKSQDVRKKNDEKPLKIYSGYINDVILTSDNYFYFGETKLYYPKELLFTIKLEQENKGNIFEQNIISMFLMNGTYIEIEQNFSLNDLKKRCEYFLFVANLFKKSGIPTIKKELYKGTFFDLVFFNSNLNELKDSYDNIEKNKEKIKAFNNKKIEFIEKRKKLNQKQKSIKGVIRSQKGNNRQKNNNSEIAKNIETINKLKREIRRLEKRNAEINENNIDVLEKNMYNTKEEIKILKKEIENEMNFFSLFDKNNVNHCIVEILKNIN